MATAYLVRVRLAVIAKKLSIESGELCNELGAARWLTQSTTQVEFAGTKSEKRTIDPSPFAQTDEWARFYTEVDPANLLSEDEIETIQDVRIGYQGLDKQLRVRAPYAKRK